MIELKVDLFYERADRDIRNEAKEGRNRRVEADAEESRRLKAIEALEKQIEELKGSSNTSSPKIKSNQSSPQSTPSSNLLFLRLKTPLFLEFAG